MMELTVAQITFVGILIFIVAALYSSVGHGGASGYLAVLSFFMLAPSLMSTTALVLNVLVAGVGTIQFVRSGHFSLRLAWPFMVSSIPAAFLGGYLKVTENLYFVLLAAVLIFAAYRLARAMVRSDDEVKGPSVPIALSSGAGIGVLSGIVGVGGGIFLSPIMIFLGWATTKQTAAVSAFFIVVNSIAGLAGRAVRGGLELGAIWPFVLAAFAGGMIGSTLGARKFSGLILRRILAVVLLIASMKLIILVVK